MNNSITFNPNHAYDEVENKLVDAEKKLQTIEVKTRCSYNENKNISEFDRVYEYEEYNNSDEHLYEEVIPLYTKEQTKKQKKNSFKRIFSFYSVIKSKITKTNSKDVEYCNQNTSTNNHDDYEYVRYSLDRLSSSQKKELGYHNSKNQKDITKKKSTLLSRIKSKSHKYDIENPKRNQNDYFLDNKKLNSIDCTATNIQRELDKEGYEVPICQQIKNKSLNVKKNKGSKKIKRKFSLYGKNKNNSSTTHLITDNKPASIEVYSDKPLSTKKTLPNTDTNKRISLSLDNSEEKLLYSTLKGIVQQRKDRFEELSKN